jgi:hypothetical protein
MKTVVTAGALDTKGADYEFLVRSVRSHGVNALTVDFGVLGDPPFIPDVTNAEVAPGSWSTPTAWTVSSEPLPSSGSPQRSRSPSRRAASSPFVQCATRPRAQAAMVESKSR